MSSHSFNLFMESGELMHGETILGRLNQSESDITASLYQGNGHIVSKEYLLDIGWPNKFVTPNSLNVAIKNIRACFEKNNIDDIIITHVKKGFSWNKKYQLNILDEIDFAKKQDNTLPPASREEPKKEALESLIVNEVSEISDVVTHLSFKEIAHLVLLIILTIIATFLAVIHSIYWTPLDCYQIAEAMVCGVGDFRRDLMPSTLTEGMYLFGYDAPDGEFFYAKI